MACKRASQTSGFKTYTQNMCKFMDLRNDFAKDNSVTQNEDGTRMKPKHSFDMKCLAVQNDMIVFHKTKSTKDKLQKIINYAKEEILVCKINTSEELTDIGSFNLKYSFSCENPEVTVYSCSINADRQFLLLAVELSHINGYKKTSECGIIQFCLSSGKEVGRHKTSDGINPSAIFHPSNPDLFYTLVQNPNTDKMQLREVATKDGHVSKTATLNIDTETEMSVTLDITQDGEYLIVQALEQDFEPNEYIDKISVYDSKSLQCLKRYTPIIVEPCHTDCVANFRPEFLPGNEFCVKFISAYLDDMFGPSKETDNIYKKNGRLNFKLPVKLSLKFQARTAIRSNICCDVCIEDLPVPTTLRSYLRQPRHNVNVHY